MECETGWTSLLSAMAYARTRDEDGSGGGLLELAPSRLQCCSYVCGPSVMGREGLDCKHTLVCI